tara:strand:+ start:4040 stop:5203 length:1164 start_codon:yes stop_codon:yes gene_type:complete
MSDETIKVDLTQKGDSANKDQSSDVDFKVDLSKPTEAEETLKDEGKPKDEEASKEGDEPKAEANSKDEEKPKVQDKKQTKEEILSAYLTDKYELDINSLEDVLSNKDKKQVNKLPEEIEKYLEYKKDTNRGLKDYMKLQQDFDEANQNDLLVQYYKETNPGLNDEDVSFLIEQKFEYKESIHTDSEKKVKELEKKKELFKAKQYFNDLKEKYKSPLESSNENVPDEYKEAFSNYNKYQEESKKNKEIQDNQRAVFDEKTRKLFNDDFKGFEFNVGEKSLVYQPKDSKDVMDKNSNLNNFISKHIDEKGSLKSAADYHRAMDIAMNPEKYAKFFYDQGKSDAVNEVVKDGKNINMDVRSKVDSSTTGTKFKVLQDSGNFSSGLKIKKR